MFIATSGAVPRVVSLHSIPLEIGPHRFIDIVDIAGTLDSLPEVIDSMLGKSYAVDSVLNGIGETTGGANNGDGAVAHRDHLAEAARFKAGRHEEHVTTGIDEGGHISIVFEEGGHFIVVVRSELTEHVFVLIGTSTEDNKLGIAGMAVEEEVHGLAHDIEPFLVVKARNHGKERDIIPLGETGHGLESAFVGFFAIEVIEGEGLFDAGIGGGIPEVVVEAIEDTMDIKVAMAEEFFEVGPPFTGHDFTGVAGANGIDHGGVVDTAGHEVNLAVRFFAEGVGLHAHIVKDIPRAVALVGEVMDGEDGGEGAVPIGVLAGGGEPHDGGGGVPVMGVEDIGFPLEGDGEVEGGAAEEGEAIGVVTVAIDVITVEEVAFGDEVDGDIGIGDSAFEDAGGEEADAHGDFEGDIGDGDIGEGALFDFAVGGHDDADVVAEGFEGDGEASGDIAEAASFGEGVNFSAEEKNF